MLYFRHEGRCKLVSTTQKVQTNLQWQSKCRCGFESTNDCIETGFKYGTLIFKQVSSTIMQNEQEYGNGHD